MDDKMKLLGETIKPKNCRVIVVRDVEKEREILHVPEEMRERFNSGVIVAVAPDCDSGYEAGQRVAFQKWGGINQEAVLHDGTVLEFVSIRQEELTMEVRGGAFVREARKESV
ncbi:MAG: hypothetical protein ACX94C_11710 [Phycisphaerales bacterium]